MFFKSSKAGQASTVSARHALRHLVVLQIKLVLDAVRDFALSPISILVFVLDVIRKPAIEDSYYLRLMRLGRHSDRVINLFDEYSDGDHYTVDETLAGVEQTLRASAQKKTSGNFSAGGDAGPE